MWKQQERHSSCLLKFSQSQWCNGSRCCLILCFTNKVIITMPWPHDSRDRLQQTPEVPKTDGRMEVFAVPGGYCAAMQHQEIKSQACICFQVLATWSR